MGEAPPTSNYIQVALVWVGEDPGSKIQYSYRTPFTQREFIHYFFLEIATDCYIKNS